MDTLEDLIRSLQKASRYTPTSQTYDAESLIEEYVDVIRRSIDAAVYLAINKSSELTRYPPLKSHLIETFRLYLNIPEEFFRISGIQYQKYANKFVVERPNLRALGTYQDWVAMKEAGHNLFSVKRVSTSDSQKLAGWKYFYKAWWKEAEKDYDIYPAIISARLAWGKGAKKAPYWYFIDKKATKKGYPEQELVGLSHAITNISQRYALIMNRELARRTEDNYLLMNENGIADFANDCVQATIDGTKRPRIEDYDIFVVYGKLNNRQVTATEIKGLLADDKIGMSTRYSSGGKLHFYERGTGHMTGIYAQKLSQ